MSLVPQQHEYPFYFIVTSDSVLRIPRLPDELMLAILEHVPLVELRRICTVSWKFYELAHQAGLTVHRTIATAGQLAAWDQIVRSAPSRHSKDPVSKLSLAIDYRGMFHGISPRMLTDTLLAISRALPRLVRLNVCASRNFTERLLVTLSAPAKVLRSLDIRQLETVDPRITTFPATLFACQPASLRAVTLDVPLLSPSPAAVPAFSNVIVVHLTVGPGQRHLAVAQFFPAARELHLGILWAERGVTIDLSNLSLRLLAIDNAALGGRAVEFTHCEGGRAPQVAAVEYRSISVPRNPLFWPVHASGLTGRMYHTWSLSRTVVELSNADGSWRSTAYLPAPSSWSSLAGDTTLEQLQRVSLVALIVDEDILEALIHSPIALAELSELSVDLSVSTRRTSERHDWDWDISWDTVHAIIIVSLSISCALDHFWPWQMVYPAPLALLGRIARFLCVLSCALCALWFWDSLHRPTRAHALPRLRCPSLECVRLLARNNTPLVLDAEGLGPLLELLAHSRVRPRLVLDGVVLDLRTQLEVMWCTFRIPVSVPSVSRAT